jgi:acetyl-CoA synthetase (ADP-forming)
VQANEALEKILKPKSIAVIGASTDPLKWGHMLLNAVKQSGFKGKIYPINLKAKEILGLKCYSTVNDVPFDIDMCIVVVPAQIVPNVFQDIKKKKIKGAVIITSGFSESGKEGTKIIEKVKEIASGDTRFIGPNCMGIACSESNLSALMIPFLHEGGDVALISQSGGYGVQLYLRADAMGVGINKFISSGNESDLKGWNYLEYFRQDEETKIIAMYIEGLKNGRKWFDIAKTVTPKKPIIVIKVGVTEEGRKAAVSHTASVAGSNQIYDAAFKQAGVIRASDAEEMFDFIKGLLYSPLPNGRNIGVISNSGGVAVETVDRLIQNGLKVPTLNENALEEIKKLIPNFGNPKNPIDLTASLDINSFINVTNIVLKQPEIHGLITLSLGTSTIKTMFPDLTEENLRGILKWIYEKLIKTYKKYQKPVIVIDPLAFQEEASTKLLEKEQIPVYTTPRRAADVMNVLYRRKEYTQKVL